MSNPIVRALEQATQRGGRTLSRDAGNAVEQVYRQAGRGVQDVVKRVSEADEHSARKLVDTAVLRQLATEPLREHFLTVPIGPEARE